MEPAGRRPRLRYGPQRDATTEPAPADCGAADQIFSFADVFFFAVSFFFSFKATGSRPPPVDGRRRRKNQFAAEKN